MVWPLEWASGKSIHSVLMRVLLRELLSERSAEIRLVPGSLVSVVPLGEDAGVHLGPILVKVSLV